ncbi:MAG: DEAD/DEAH box helicase [Candidatus Heimdallarchaeota archaeon]|nr:DEAD/DEAH box helicase [Candidatus Heimdallarchaeota archaeon]
MNSYISHPFIKKDTIQARIYQQILFAEAVKQNSLIILPTGLGKTIIMIMIIAHFLKNSEGKIIIVAPTKPLIDQHLSSFKKFLNIEDELIILMSGSLSPQSRVSLWKSGRIIVATPQIVRNDIVRGIVNLTEVSLICYDEAHRAIGDDPYVLSAEVYAQKNLSGRIVGFTASPKDKEKLREIVQNLSIEIIKYMDEKNDKIKPYIHGSDEEVIWLELPEKIKYILDIMKLYVEENYSILKKLDCLPKNKYQGLSKKSLIQVPKLLNKKRNQLDDTDFFAGMRAYGQIMLVYQGIEMLETQGVETLNSYFSAKILEFKKENKSSLRFFLQNENITKAREMTMKLIQQGIRHPKIEKLIDFVQITINSNQDSRILIFANYKATVYYIIEELKLLPNIKIHHFVGQSKSSYGDGLSQKDQKEVMDYFRSGEYNVLVSTSVGEEGLDVAQCDFVIFYDITPSSTRLIQRSGRTGRSRRGKIIKYVTKGTRDEVYFYSSRKKAKGIKKAVNDVMEELSSTNKNNPKNQPLSAFFSDDRAEEKQGKDVQVNTDKILIQIDHREKGSAILRELLNSNVEIKQVELEIGDFILSERVAVERKTISDFCNSLIDQRLFTQLSELKRTYLKPILIIEGNDHEGCRIQPNAYRGALASIMIDFSIPIYHCANPKETVEILLALAKREQEDNKRSNIIRTPLSRGSIYEDQLALIAMLPNINTILANKLLVKFGSPNKIFQATLNELKEVHGIGDQIARKIIDILNTSYEINSDNI